MRPPCFIFSFDCESLWGMADRIGPQQRAAITRVSLLRVYEDLLKAFREFQIPATFGFVGALTLTADAAEAHRPYFERVRDVSGGWLKPLFEDWERGDVSAWFIPELAQMVQAEGIHELGSHTFSHFPWRDPSFSAEFADEELRRFAEIPMFRDRADGGYTLIFPRNQIAHLDRFAGTRFVGVRLDRTFRSRVSRLASELDLVSGPQPHATVEKGKAPVNIPAGVFFNWRRSLRRTIPAIYTEHRLKCLLRNAINKGCVLHVYSHPHNFITGANMFSPLRGLLREAAKHRDAGRLQTVTQLGYVQATLAQN